MPKTKFSVPGGPVVYKDYLMPSFPPLVADVNGHLSKIKHFQSRKSDILICTYPKSGTNWINEVVSMVVKGRAEYNTVYKIDYMLELLPDFSCLENLPDSSTRVINTHVPFDDLPRKHIESGYKVVHMLRNPKDVAVSFYHHGVRQKIRNSSDRIVVPKGWSQWLNAFSKLHPLLYGGWFNYEKGFESAKASGKLTNVFTIEFEELKRNPIPILRGLAKFLDVDLTDETLQDINEKCSFENLSTFGTQVKDNTDIIAESRDGTNFYFRKGVVGDWKNWFTVAQNEEFNRLIEKELEDGSKLKWYLYKENIYSRL